MTVPSPSEWNSLWWMLEIAGASLLGGVVGAISGLGGGIVIVPVLTIFLKVPIQVAIGASIISVIAVSSGAGAVYVKDRITNVRIAMFLELSTAAGAIVGAGFLAHKIPEKYLYLLFGSVLLLSLLPILVHIGQELPQGVHNDRLANFLKLNGSYYDKRLKREVEYNVTGIPAGMAVMGFAGIISGLLGIGAGVVKVIAQEIAMKMPTKVSTATSNFMIGVTAAAAAGVYLHGGKVMPYMVVPVSIAVLAGAYLGTKLMERMSNSHIRQVFALLLAIIGVQMVLRAFNFHILGR